MTSSRLLALAAWMFAAFVLIVNVPAFLCMGLDPDPLQFDLFARNVAADGVPYRDVCENNLPGMLWIHLGVRSLFGWSFEALRAVDLVVMTAVTVLLAMWIPGLSLAARGLVAALLLSFYFSTSEWCHCQRDPWMLLPALAAAWLRRMQVQRSSVGWVKALRRPTTPQNGGSAQSLDPPYVTPSPIEDARNDRGCVFTLAMLEGLIWGALVWIKPYIIVPALAAWLWSVREMTGRRNTPLTPAPLPRSGGEGFPVQASSHLRAAILTPSPPASGGEGWGEGGRPHVGRRVLADLFGLLVGGFIAGAAGIAWLNATGAWPWFAETVFVWNRDYIAIDAYEGIPTWMVWLGFGLRNSPWSIAYLVAVPYAIVLLLRRQADTARTLLAAFFLGWLLQAVVLQHCFDYVHTPALLLALVLIVDGACHLARPGNLALGGLLALLAIWGHSSIALQRVASMPRCLSEGNTPEMRDQLGRLVRQGSWVELERVARFLERQQLHNGELTCIDMPSAPLYLRLNLNPSTRYTLLQNCLFCFKSHRDEIKDAVAASSTRFLVCDFTTLHSHPRNVAPNAGEPGLPPLPEGWGPWKKRIVFRAGRFLVLQLDGEETRRWLTEVLGF